MNGYEKLLDLLNGQMTEPQPYGWFHLLSVALVIGLIVVVFFTCKNLTDKQFRIICIVTASIMLLFEIYKQLNFSYDPATGKWDYQWYAFPFQFCSTPMYVLLLAGIVKPGKFQDFLCSFLATFGIFAGIIVMILPTTVFVETIGINIQTMVHHGLMIVIGFFMYVSKRAKLEHKTILKGMAVFGVLFVIAFVSNIIVHYSSINETFNMFFVSPFDDCELIILQDIQNINYYLFLFAYLVGFSLAGYIMLLIAKLVSLISRKVKSRRLTKAETKAMQKQ